MKAGDRLGGGRPSLGAASTVYSAASGLVGAGSHSNIAAPEDGRTPIKLPPGVNDPLQLRAESD